MQSNSNEIISKKAFILKKVLRPLARLAALRHKKPAPQGVSTVFNYCKFSASNIHCPQLARTLRNSRG